MQALSGFLIDRADRAEEHLDNYVQRVAMMQEYAGGSPIEDFAVLVLKARARARGWKILSNVAGVASTNQQ